MKHKIGKVIIAIFLLAAMSQGAFTSYPSYNTETDCRSCHGITADRHHLLVADGTHQCTNCHAMKYDTLNQTYYPEVIRNCLTCHPGKDHTDTHHLLVAQALFICSDCHAMKYDDQTQTYYPEIIWDCTVCHSTVLSPDSPPPMPNPLDPPTITSFSPLSPLNDIVGASRTFEVTTDQTVNVTWYINGTPIQSNEGITFASYTNVSAAMGIWNVTAEASNDHGTVMYTWTWNVTSLFVVGSPIITSFAPITSPLYDIVGSSRKFGITIDQTANIVWYINGNQVQFNDSVMGASYNNTSATIGVWNVSAIATNANGNVMRSWTWKVIYNFDFLPPVNTDVSSVFKLGSIVPIKFQLRDANGNYITSAVARLNFTKIISTTAGANSESSATETETISDVFIYSNTNHMYKYNLATKKMSNGTWQIRVDIDDGSSNTVNISLKN